MKKITSHPDVSQLQGEGIHAPDLAIKKTTKLSLSKKRDAAITKHLEAAKKHLTPEVHEFSRKLVGNKKLHDIVRQYSNTAARTTGERSVEGLKAHAQKFIHKTNKSEKGRAKALAAVHGEIDANAHHFHAMFQAHHHLNMAKHHMLDQFKEHQHQFDIGTHGGEEHEGLVSTLGKGKKQVQVKLVREGPGGFPAKNFANPRFNKGQETNEETSMRLSLDIANTTLMETHYLIHGVDDISVDQVMELIPIEELEMLAEGAKRKIVIRGGKKRIIFKCPPGMKLAARGSRACKKMGGAEKAKRSRIARRSAVKARRKKATANRKRAKSLRRRKMFVRR